MRNLKVSLKLVLGFSIVILMAIAVGVTGIVGMYRINKADDALYKENLLAIAAMAELRETLQRERVGNRNFVLDAGNAAKIQEWNDMMTQLNDIMTKQFAIYESAITDETEEQDYYEAKRLYNNEYSKIKNDIYTASLIGFDAAYERLFDSTVAEMTNKMVDAFTVSMQKNTKWGKDTVDKNSSLFMSMMWLEIGILIFVVIVAMSLVFYISRMIRKPLSVLTAFMKKAGETGDISLRQEDIENINKYSKYKDETGQCIGSTANFVKHITLISNELETISNGDLSVEVALLSDKDTIGISLKKTLDKLNGMFREINNSTSQVMVSSKQTADGATALAQGATEQAASLQEISSSVSEVAVKTQENTKLAVQSAELSDKIQANAQKGSSQMDSMIQAVSDINDASHSISEVIKTIDNIAFQTNILALNASVEASHAGQHGKGFAIVPAEVRRLAAESAEAAKHTAGLIANCVEKAELGSKIASETATSLSEIVSGINESSRIANDIAKSSQSQNTAITQVNSSLEQVAQVVQQNSATAEESAAASEEMSSQSDVLHDLISQFKLKDDIDAGRYTHQGMTDKRKSPAHKDVKSLLPASSDNNFGKY